ncbi:MAG: hypothetical protein OFPI_31880 [Osedax symbiont Rs2]|nr:MAG: hypothetical protein OFPI_31880 [Osedax symbiont Rs2]
MQLRLIKVSDPSRTLAVRELSWKHCCQLSSAVKMKAVFRLGSLSEVIFR